MTEMVRIPLWALLSAERRRVRKANSGLRERIAVSLWWHKHPKADRPG